MAQKDATELVSILLFDKNGRILLKSIENRGLWLPTEPKKEDEPITTTAQKIADSVS